MALFGFGKKKEEVKEAACCCGSTPAPEVKADPVCSCNGNAPEFVAKLLWRRKMRHSEHQGSGSRLQELSRIE